MVDHIWRQDDVDLQKRFHNYFVRSFNIPEHILCITPKPAKQAFLNIENL